MPASIHISDGKLHDINVPGILPVEAWALLCSISGSARACWQTSAAEPAGPRGQWLAGLWRWRGPRCSLGAPSLRSWRTRNLLWRLAGAPAAGVGANGLVRDQESDAWSITRNEDRLHAL